MSSWCRRSRVISGVFVGGPDGGIGAGLRVHAQDKKPDPKKPDTAAAQAQSEEVQSLVRLADAAMTGQQAPSDFPIQFQNDFLKAQNARVWVPITLTIDSSKLTTGALTLYLRVAPRGMTCAPDACARDGREDGPEEERQEEGRQAGRRTRRPIRSRTSRSSI